MDGFPEAEFLASGYGGEDVIFAGAEPVLAVRVLLTGYHGDRVWSLNADHISDDLRRGDPSGASLLEFRLERASCTCPSPSSARAITGRYGPSPTPRRCSLGVLVLAMTGRYRGASRRRWGCLASFSARQRRLPRSVQSGWRDQCGYQASHARRSLADVEEFVRAHPDARSALDRSLPAPVGRVLGSRKFVKPRDYGSRRGASTQNSLGDT